jgi:predicted ATP-grasp superfamily ATP-dependent carboligase
MTASVSTIKSPAYVLWFGVTGLSVARALGRNGIEVFGLHDDPNEPCATTRYAQVIFLPPVERDARAWIDWLMEEGRRIAPVKGVLIPAADAHWIMVKQNLPELERHFHIAMPRHGEAEQWVGKPFQYAVAERAGVPFPATVTVEHDRDLDAACRRIGMPCLVKPVLSHLWQREYGVKLSFMQTREDVRARAGDALSRGLAVMIQEYIPAADDEIYGLFVCVDRQSRPLGYCVSRKLRQHEPRFGNSSMSMCVNEPRVVELGLRLVRELGYHGIGSAEFKRDPRDGEFKLMEFNLRPTSLMGLAFDSGVNLPLLSYQELCQPPSPDIEPTPVTPARFGRRVGSFASDLRVARYYRKVDSMSYWKWLRSWIGARDVHFAWDDPKPWLGSVHSFLLKIKRGNYRGIPETFPTPEQWLAGLWDGTHRPPPVRPASIAHVGPAPASATATDRLSADPAVR